MPLPPKHTKSNPLTTAGRIAKAAHNRDQANSISGLTSSPPDSAPPKKKSRKTPVLAPPAELEAEALRRAEAKKKPKPKAKKAPLTTKDKIADSNNKKKKQPAPAPVERDGESLKAVDGGEAKMKGLGVKKGGKPRNLMDIMREQGQMNSAVPVAASSTVAGKVQTVASSGAKRGAKGKAKARESVLVRPTERTMRMQQSLQRLGQKTQTTAAAPSVKVKRENDDEPSSDSQASLVGLPLELRQRIWRLSVVETEFFVYPAINQEQPDLAMTSRQIRNEVLPLYYGENTFAIEIPVNLGAGLDKKKARGPERESLLLMRKWATALADRECLGTIRKWALSWAPPAKYLRAGGPDLQVAENREFIVSICYPKPGSVNNPATRPGIEIHRQAFCLLRSHELFHPCNCMSYPVWLDNAAAAALLAAGQDRGKQISMIAKDVEKRAEELVESRCEGDVMELE